MTFCGIHAVLRSTLLTVDGFSRGLSERKIQHLQAFVQHV